MRVLIATYLVLLLAVFISCRKDKITVLQPEELMEGESCSCEPLNDNEYISGLDYLVYDETYYLSPQINPNNANEIAFTDGQEEDSEIKIMIYNKETNEKRILVNEPTSNFFSWGKKDWIIYQRSADFNLYKIKSNGDSLTQLTFDGQWFHPRWNYSGDRFMVYKKDELFEATYMMDENAQVVDTMIGWKHTNGDWSHPDLYVGIRADRLVIIDPATDQVIKEMMAPFSNKEFKGVGWISLDRIFFSVGQTFFTYTISTDKVEQVYCKCHQYIRSVSHTSDFSSLVFNKVEFSALNEDDILVDSKLIWMQANGLGEYELKIP